MKTPSMRYEDVKAIARTLEGCYRLSLGEKLPLVAIITPMAMLPLVLSACAFARDPTFSKGSFVACGFLIFGLFLASIMTVAWSGKCFISETHVGFSAFPPFSNWMLSTVQIQAISLLEQDGVYHVQFHVKHRRTPKSFFFSSKDLQAKIRELFEVKKEGQQNDGEVSSESALSDELLS